MANISDTIEQYILDTFAESDCLCISRNGLAEFFNCSPSQINYVLTTRFNIDRGYIIESRRGGGGYLNVIKVTDSGAAYITALLQNEIGDSITYHRSANILSKLRSDELITDREMDIILSCINDKALFLPSEVAERVRARILSSSLKQIMKHI